MDIKDIIGFSDLEKIIICQARKKQNDRTKYLYK